MARYSKKAQQEIEKTLHEFKEGKLRSGQSDQKVIDRDQAIAIGISKARDKGYKVPPEE